MCTSLSTESFSASLSATLCHIGIHVRRIILGEESVNVNDLVIKSAVVLKENDSYIQGAI